MNFRTAAMVSLRLALLSILLLGLLPADSRATAFFQAAPVITIPNLVAYWDVDADTGTIATDSSGNNNTGTYTAGASRSTTVQGVPTGNTLSFNFVKASNQYISVPDSPATSLAGATAFTFAAWIRPTLDSADQQGIIEKFDAGGNGFSFRLDASDNLSFTIRNGATSKDISTVPRALTRSVWTHVAGVYDQAAAAQMVNYVNATKDALDSATPGYNIQPVLPPTDAAEALQIGKDYGTNAFEGQIDEVRIYNRALTQAEVSILRSGQPPATALVATADIDQVNLTWTAAAGATSYVIQRSTDPAGPWTNAGTATGTAFTDTGATFPGTYYFRVISVSVMAGAPAGPAGPATPTSPIPPPPRTNDHEEGLLGGDRCSCGSVPPAGIGGLGAAVLGALALLALALRR